MKISFRPVFWLLLLISPALVACQQATPTGVAQDADPVLFQLNDHQQSLVDAHLMLTTTYGTRTDRLLLPGFENEEGCDIYRIRHQDQVFVFYETVYGLFGGRYRIEVFDLQGNLIKQGEFYCSENDIPVTLIKVTGEDGTIFPIYGIGLFRTYRAINEADRESAELFGTDPDPDGDGHLVMPIDAGDLAHAYLAIDYATPYAYRKEHGLDQHTRVGIKFFRFEGEQAPPDESIIRNREDIFVESVGIDIPFYRFDTDEEGDLLPPFMLERP